MPKELYSSGIFLPSVSLYGVKGKKQEIERGNFMVKQIRCPYCKLRLFDLKSKEVALEIKCPRCKRIVNIEQH